MAVIIIIIGIRMVWSQFLAVIYIIVSIRMV